MSSLLVRTHPWLVGPRPRGGLSTRVGFPTGDGRDPQAGRAALRADLARMLELPPQDVAWVEQVHGARVCTVEAPGAQGEADAMVCQAPGPLLFVSVADCCPVLAWDAGTGAYGVAHAGWRGLVAGVLPPFVTALAGLGARVDRLRAWIGPSIGPCCFEVGQEVADRFSASCVVAAIAPPVTRSGTAERPRPHVDLRRACVEQLASAGVGAERIAVCEDCTSCRRELYYSYRRDRGICGRHLGYLSL